VVLMATHVAKQMATQGRGPAIPVADPILAAKITAPGVPDWAVPRSRITGLLAQGTRWCPLTVVTGPPGAGKTMALALWAAAEPRAVAWISLDRYDNQPGAFWSYVVAALSRSGVAIPRELPAAARGRPADHEFLLRLVSALVAQDPPVLLVLDDFHLLTEPGVLHGLDFVLRNVGSGLRVVVSSRMDPMLRLHRYRLAGELTEIRASDLAFNIAEAGQLIAQHGGTLSADSLQCLTRRTEGWAAGLRLAAISLGAHPDPDQFVKELITEDSALTGYLVDEVLNAQPPEVRDVLLSTSILQRVSAEAASELAGTEKAAGILSALARANTFIQPIGGGWYCYHPLFAEVLRLKLRSHHPERMPGLHRRAARFCERNGSLPEAVRHAAEAGDWQLAARMVIGGLAISEIIEPQDRPSLASEFASMPDSGAWTEPGPYLISAAAALTTGQHEPSVAALATAEGMLGRLPADQQAAGRLAAATIRLAAARRTGDLTAAAASAAQAEVLVTRVSGDNLARHPRVRAQVLAGRGAVELWSGHLDEAARVLDSGVAAATAPGTDHERADCLGHLALAAAVRGRLGHAADLAAPVTAAVTADERRLLVQRPSPAALVALAWVHSERNELRQARSLLKQADAALSRSPDKLIGTVAWLLAACADLAEGRAEGAVECVARARSGWHVPAWLEQELSLAESQACAAAGDIRAALAAAGRIDGDSSLTAAVVRAHAWAAAGDTTRAERALAPALAAHPATPQRAQVRARLVDAQLSYASGDQARGQRSLAAALRLAEPEQFRLPFLMEGDWLRRVLRQDPGLAHRYQRLLSPALRREQLLAPAEVPGQPATVVVEPLSEREREVLRHVSGMLSTAEVATEMYISVNTVKTHLRSIYRKLAATHRGEAVRRARQFGWL
jgi:LuxR family maltose regulon positive regulatory protein